MGDCSPGLRGQGLRQREGGRRVPAHLELHALHQEAELKGIPLLEGHVHLPLLCPPASFLLRVTDHIPALFKPRVEVEGNVPVTEAGLKIHSKPGPRGMREGSGYCPWKEQEGSGP